MLEDLYSKIDTAFKTLKLNYTSRALAQLLAGQKPERRTDSGDFHHA